MKTDKRSGTASAPGCERQTDLGMMKHYKQKSRSRKGMVMLMVLFIVMAIAVISSGFIARSDTALACGKNFCVRNEVDYAAWGGLEVALALVVQDPNMLSTSMTDQLDASSQTYYDLTINSPVSDPNVYPVTCSGYKQVNGQDRARSTLYGELYYDSTSGTTYYLSVKRQ